LRLPYVNNEYIILLTSLAFTIDIWFVPEELGVILNLYLSLLSTDIIAPTVALGQEIQTPEKSGFNVWSLNLKYKS
jgi:hypothetical protein